MAFFVADTPLQIAGRWLDRGFLVVGGASDAVTALQDAWVFDVAAEPAQCPWLLASLDVLPGGGLLRGSMVFAPDQQQFVLVGGLEDFGSYTASVDDVRVLPLSSLGDNPVFATQALAPPTTATVIAIDTPWCGGQPGQGYEAPRHPCIVREGEEGIVCSFSEHHYDACTGIYENACGSETSIPITPPCSFGPKCDPGFEWLDGDFYARSLPTIGLADAALTLDADGVVRAHGGTMACVGACPQIWGDVMNLDGSGYTQSAQGANSARRLDITLIGSQWSADGTAEPSYLPEFLPSNWPADASVGFRGAAGVVTGLDWVPSTRRWEAQGDVRHLLFGGTAHQDVSGQTWFEVDWIPDLQCNLVSVPSFPMWTPEPLDALSGPSGFAPGSPLVSIDPNSSVPSYTGHTLVPSIAPRANAAAALFDQSGFLVFGGQEEIEPGWFVGTDPIEFVNVSSVPWTLETVGTVGYLTTGAGLVVDPFTRVAWAFGGNLTEAATWSISHSGSKILSNQESAFIVLGMEQEIAKTSGSTLSDAQWQLRYGYRLGHSCAHTMSPSRESWMNQGDLSSRCFADRITLEFRDQSPGAGPDGLERSSAVVRVKVGEMWYLATPIESSDKNYDIQGSNIDIQKRSYRLPRTLADGELVDVEVTLQATTEMAPVSQSLDIAINKAAMHYAEIGDPASQLVYLKQVLARPDGVETAQLMRSHLVGSSVYKGVAPGLSVPCNDAGFSILSVTPSADSRCLVTGEEGETPFLLAKLDDALVVFGQNPCRSTHPSMGASKSGRKMRSLGSSTLRSPTTFRREGPRISPGWKTAWGPCPPPTGRFC